MSVIVQKFGGSSVKDTAGLQHAAKIITDTFSKGHQVLVVVSAQGTTTDDLIAKANAISDCPAGREMDVLLSSGEQISMSLLAMAVHALGYPVVSLTGWQAGVVTQSEHQNAKILKIYTERMQMELAKKNIVIVAGFQGIDHTGDITTLGRGGSDTSAVAIAAAMNADLCQIYTDVDGVFTADPRIVPSAKKLDEVTYDEMLELASLGANVLHDRSVELAREHHVPMEVLSSHTTQPGTRIGNISCRKGQITGATLDRNIVRCFVCGLPGSTRPVFSALSAEQIPIDMLLLSEKENDKADISFTIPTGCREQALHLLLPLAEALGANKVTCDDSLAKVSVVGKELSSNPLAAAAILHNLEKVNVPINTFLSGKTRLSVLVNQQDGEKALRAIHKIMEE